jgi:hypothetical protein
VTFDFLPVCCAELRDNFDRSGGDVRLIGSFSVKLIVINTTSKTNNTNVPLHNVQNKSLHGICSPVSLITVTCIPIARQRVGKEVPAKTDS